ncbi:MAG: RNA polymerase sigma factor, partial [Pseudolabrys sp.]
MFVTVSHPAAEAVSSSRPSGPSAIDLDALFRLYSQELNSYAYGRLKAREAAADVVQDSFLRFLVWHRSPHARDLP